MKQKSFWRIFSRSTCTKISQLYKISRFITMFTKPHQKTLSFGRLIQPMPPCLL